jgi:aldose 1-epimerase
MKVSLEMVKTFGTSPAGETVKICQLRAGGSTARILSWGATLQDYRVADVDHSLVLGSESLDAYLGPMRYFGAIVGPVANRIAQGRMQIGDKIFHLDTNENGRTTLHSGGAGFSDWNWTLRQVSDDTCQLTLEHPDGMGGFPGNTVVSATYNLDREGALSIEITGQSDADTYFNPAFHGYWNLSEQPNLSDHRLTIRAEKYLPVDADQIPLGGPVTVDGTDFDYRRPRSIGSELDHNFCLEWSETAVQTVCRLQTPALELNVQTNQPGVQIYNGIHIDTGTFNGHTGRPYGPCAGLAIEPQFWPDSPNHPTYPSCLLKEGQTCVHRTRFQVLRSS